MNLKGDAGCSESDLDLLCRPNGEQCLNDKVSKTTTWWRQVMWWWIFYVCSAIIVSLYVIDFYFWYLQKSIAKVRQQAHLAFLVLHEQHPFNFFCPKFSTQTCRKEGTDGSEQTMICLQLPFYAQDLQKGISSTNRWYKEVRQWTNLGDLC